MKVLKKSFITIDQNKWKNKNRKEIRKKIDKIALPWVSYEKQDEEDEEEIEDRK